MNRLEIIKERNESLHPSKRLEYDNPLDLALTWTRNYWSDTYYLLQRLEIAQKALESVADVIHVQGEHRDIGDQSQWDTALLYKVNEALNQLKE